MNDDKFYLLGSKDRTVCGTVSNIKKIARKYKINGFSKYTRKNIDELKRRIYIEIGKKKYLWNMFIENLKNIKDILFY